MNYLKFNFIVIYYLLIFIEPGLSNNSTSELPVNRRRRQLLSGVQLLLQPEFSDYLLKILPYKTIEPECSSIKKISETHDSVMTLESEVELSNEDLLKCEVLDANLIENPKSRLVLYTTGSTSDVSSVTKVSKLTEDNCFSFRVKTDGVVKIYLYTDFSLYKYTIIALGSNSNTQSYMTDNHRICENCMVENTPHILSSHELRGFWISWDENTVAVGKEGSTEILFSNTFGNIIDVKKIKFIGISTEGSYSASEWTIEEPFCPEVLAKSKEKRFILTKCHKIFDDKALSFKELSEERKLLKKVEALTLEYNTEESTTAITSSRIEYYYNYDLKTKFFEEYITLFRKCKEAEECDANTLNKIDKAIDELRKKLQNKSTTNVTFPQCSINGKFNEYYNRCYCNTGYAGNGQYCRKDSDYDGVPDENITECFGSPECRKDNCPSHYNPYQEDVNENEIGDICDRYWKSDDVVNFTEDDGYNGKSNCVELTSLRGGDSCELKWDFMVPYFYKKNYFDIIFSQGFNDKEYKITWKNNGFPKFVLNKIVKPKKGDDVILPKALLWLENSKLEEFQLGRTYRLIINYGYDWLQFKIQDVIESRKIFDKDILSFSSIAKLCITSKDISWIGEGAYSCAGINPQ